MVDDQRQAGANVVNLGAGAKDALGLRFETRNDAMRYFQEIADFCVSLKRKTNHFGIDYYLVGEFDFHIGVTDTEGDCNFTICIRVCGRRNWRKVASVGEPGRRDCDGERQNTLMLPRARKGRQCPDQFALPVLARFERSAIVNQGAIDASAFAFDLTFEARPDHADGEVDAFGIRASNWTAASPMASSNASRRLARMEDAFWRS